MRRGRCNRCGKTTPETKAGFRECNPCFEIVTKEAKLMMEKFFPLVSDAFLEPDKKSEPDNLS